MFLPEMARTSSAAVLVLAIVILVSETVAKPGSQNRRIGKNEAGDFEDFEIDLQSNYTEAREEGSFPRNTSSSSPDNTIFRFRRSTFTSMTQWDESDTPGINAIYRLFYEAETWKEARKICQANDGHLAIINSIAESQLIANAIDSRKDSHRDSANSDFVLVGYINEFVHQKFRTFDGRTPEQAGFAEWSPGEPNNGGATGKEEKCGALYRGKLNDVFCDEKYAFLCEIRPFNNVLPAGPAGPQGIRGDKGVSGSAGVKGQTGSRGPPGSPGLTGPPGPKGVRGLPGMKGETGSPGAAGLDGRKGEAGERGNNGLRGVPGEKGDRGESGPLGLRGIRGDKGISGSAGTKGERGSQGPPGSPGLTGPPGPNGAQGSPGTKGDAGSSGAAGLDGRKGEPGERGKDGLPGAASQKGERGDSGRPGPQGFTGPPGQAGDRGPSGPAGPKGNLGAPGPQGPKGETGVGEPGPPGPAGLSYDDGCLAVLSTLEQNRAYSLIDGGEAPISTGNTKPHEKCKEFVAKAYEQMSLRDPFQDSVHPNGEMDSPAKTCKHLFLAYPDKSSGEYWIDPNGDDIDDAILVNCDAEKLTTCVTPEASRTPNSSYTGDEQEVWLSEIDDKLQITYDAATNQINALQALSRHAEQNVTYHCLRSVAYFDTEIKTYDRGLKLLAWNDVEFQPRGSRHFRYDVISDGCKDRPDEWNKTVITYRTNQPARLPVLDVGLRDVGKPDQQFSVQIGEVCFS